MMKHTSRIILAALFSIALSTAAQADDHKSYGARFGHKILNGLSNIALSALEIPKNIINTTNQSNVFYGLTGGLAKGIVNMAGRTTTGVTDVITSPLPTKQIVEPAYPWQDYFEKDTTYGKVFNMDTKDD
jgi:putative exosortase-associated protein (TIGR04073 family)